MKILCVDSFPSFFAFACRIPEFLTDTFGNVLDQMKCLSKVDTSKSDERMRPLIFVGFFAKVEDVK